MATIASEPTDDGGEPTRRAALVRIGRYAAYTAPFMTTLLVADKAVARSPAGPSRADAAKSPKVRVKGAPDPQPAKAEPERALAKAQPKGQPAKAPNRQLAKAQVKRNRRRA